MFIAKAWLASKLPHSRALPGFGRSGCIHLKLCQEQLCEALGLTSLLEMWFLVGDAADVANHPAPPGLVLQLNNRLEKYWSRSSEKYPSQYQLEGSFMKVAALGIFEETVSL